MLHNILLVLVSNPHAPQEEIRENDSIFFIKNDGEIHLYFLQCEPIVCPVYYECWNAQ